MRKLSQLNYWSAIICIALATFFANSEAHADTTCGPNSNAIAHTGSGNAANGDNGYCFGTPDVLQMKFYEFGLCEGNADPANRSNCTALFQNTNGIDVNLSAGAFADLVDAVTLTEGNYSHGYIIVSNTVELNLTISFSDIRNTSNVPVHGSGKVCYTDGRKMSTESNDIAFPGQTGGSIISCGAVSNAENSIETLTLNGCGGGHTSSIPNYLYDAKGVTVTTDLYLIQSDGTLSTGCAADYAFFAVQSLPNPVNITGDTNGLDVAISLSGAVSVGFTSLLNNAAPTDVMFNGLQFIITSN